MQLQETRGGEVVVVVVEDPVAVVTMVDDAEMGDVVTCPVAIDILDSIAVLEDTSLVKEAADAGQEGICR